MIVRHGEIVQPFTETSFPVGLIPNAEYAVSSVTLEPDDTLVLFSDGVTEAMDPDEEMFGRAGLLKAVVEGQNTLPLGSTANENSRGGGNRLLLRQPVPTTSPSSWFVTAPRRRRQRRRWRPEHSRRRNSSAPLIKRQKTKRLSKAAGPESLP